MADPNTDLIKRIPAGDRRAVARAISAVEDSDASATALRKELFASTGRAYVVGVTGSPGAGKSTLVEKLAGEYRRLERRVGIIAVDPTSSFTGGAILGDRIRMQSLTRDDGVYIRSMATRGHLGGLVPTAQDVVTILDAAGFQVIIIETVGVGQDEVEIARHADTTVLLLVPGMGDDIQTFKAGVMEIADVFVINKADLPGAERVEQELKAMLAFSPQHDARQRPVVETVATTGAGVVELQKAVDDFRALAESGDLWLRRRRARWRARLLEVLRQRSFERVVASIEPSLTERYLDDVLDRRRDPYSVAEELMAAQPLSLASRRPGPFHSERGGRRR